MKKNILSKIAYFIEKNLIINKKKFFIKNGIFYFLKKFDYE
jgi:hypothetical protein